MANLTVVLQRFNYIFGNLLQAIVGIGVVTENRLCGDHKTTDSLTEINQQLNLTV